MAAHRFEDLHAWQFAEELRQEAYDIVLASEEAKRALRYFGQVTEAADAGPSDIAEGFLRRSPGDFIRFLRFALGSMAELKLRLIYGAKRDYFPLKRCEKAYALYERTKAATVALLNSQIRYKAEQEERRKAKRRKKGRRNE